ncbi:MAG TPA: 2-hydroxyacyl-CoA dehydratase [Desulfotomaculum sp.]|nr:MAG: 2-hydroxyglutaryl-CoA dehydratase [Desulfotomaculum sp. BICA1-6]HBX22346.1 2-hydroxyacyl-CoA dehydratase [Desulfotomaculum sp.]
MLQQVKNKNLNDSIGEEKLELLLEEASLNGSRRRERYPDSRFFGYFCSYWPEEIVLAAGYEPLRLFPASIQAVPASLPAYCCSLARGCLSRAEKGDYADLAGTGFAHTCDTMQCLGGIWQAVAGHVDNTLQCVPPVLLEAPGARRYYLTELQNLLSKLGRLTGREPGKIDLIRALDLCRQIRRQAAELDKMRAYLPSPLVPALLRAGQVMPATEFSAALERVIPVLKERMAEPGDRCRVLVTGAVLENDSLFKMVEDLGGRVVADDTCTGYRHYYDQLSQPDTDPLEAIVQRAANMPPCPCRSRGHDYRINYLEQLALEKNAAGAVLVIRKYCEPHAWDAVPAAEQLRKSGIRTMVLELEGADVGGQERTRLQAFLESI